MSAHRRTVAVRGLRDLFAPGRHLRGPHRLAKGLRQHQIGGQALPDGVLVRTPKRWAVAIRRRDGDIHDESHEVVERWPRLRRTVLRGPLALADAISIGAHAIRISVAQTSGVAVTSEQMAMTTAPVLLGALGVFILVPSVASARWVGIAGDVIEASARAVMLLVYLAAIARSQQGKQVFAYHGAEHMAIAAFERHERVPTRDEAAAESPVHPRCGSSFIALFLIASGIVFSFVTRTPVWLGSLSRVALVPVVAVIAYESMRAAAKRPRGPLAAVVGLPGRLLQRVTTRRPPGDELEVAVAALAAATHETAG